MRHSRKEARIKTAGIDIGSRTIKVVILESGKLVDFRIVSTGVEPILKTKEILKEFTYDKLIATGYGRHLAKEHFNCPVMTEIKAYTIGAHHYFSNCRTIIDIGGQDSKTIRVTNGRVDDFEMNDRCAAGSGKFLEIMAYTLGFSIDNFGEEALKADTSVTVNSMCTVFAESEVISLIARGENPRNIALGLHQSILDRLMGMIGRIGFEEDVIFAGGVAKNRCMISLLEKRLKKKVWIPEEPQIVGAIGAALNASDEVRNYQINKQ